MTLEDLCKQALELDEKATKDWHVTVCQHGGQILHRGLDKRGGHPQPHLQIVPTDDASLIAFYRTFAPAAARVLLVAKEALELEQFYYDKWDNETDLPANWPRRETGKLKSPAQIVSDALTAIQVEMEGVK